MLGFTIENHVMYLSSMALNLSLWNIIVQSFLSFEADRIGAWQFPDSFNIFGFFFKFLERQLHCYYSIFWILKVFQDYVNIWGTLGCFFLVLHRIVVYFSDKFLSNLMIFWLK